MPSIDINCDMGESFGPWVMGQDLELFAHVTSANIACGFHAGDPDVMLKTVRAAIAANVAIGAHPGLPDLQGFGRRAMAMTPDEVYALVIYQVGALDAFARSQGGRLHHVKTHGALYNMTARDPALANAVARAVHDLDPTLPIYVANAAIAQAARDFGLPTVFEVYADRTYQDDGTLTPRSMPNAMIEDVGQAVAQVKRMVKEGLVRSLSGKDVPIAADTLCIHGDQPGAVQFASQIRTALEAEGIAVKTI
ncbi:LamB/YcsF family protein [Achromobacter sp. RTa]|uniref:LamB/YcsF family protein n=1 Tax=Achromobacter sp. RTa TaxID=1532557 RepID=UPI00050DBE7A|nr:5-oxoprolinase subunit PxpA [Achromobacter sp. RTa]KGE00402.1 LamB/YcsF family protein [Achromobacter sp. RTa]